MAYFQAPTENFVSTTLNGAITDSDATITLNDASKLQAPGYVVIDREDASGTATASKREVVYYTGIDGNDLTGCTRGADSSTARSHNDGALVEPTFTVGMWNSLASPVSQALLPTGAGLHVANATVTGTANIGTLKVGALSGNMPGIGGQFYWGRSGALTTVQAGTAGDVHFPLQYVSKNLTINGFYSSLLSAPSTAVFTFEISYGSAPTGEFSTIFTAKPVIDVGEYSTISAASPAILALTSLASGSLLRAEIDSHGGAGELGASLLVTSR